MSKECPTTCFSRTMASWARAELFPRAASKSLSHSKPWPTSRCIITIRTRQGRSAPYKITLRTRPWVLIVRTERTAIWEAHHSTVNPVTWGKIIAIRGRGTVIKAACRQTMIMHCRFIQSQTTPQFQSIRWCRTCQGVLADPGSLEMHSQRNFCARICLERERLQTPPAPSKSVCVPDDSFEM